LRIQDSDTHRRWSSAGIAALRLMDADAIPLDVQAAQPCVSKYIAEVGERLQGSESAMLVECSRGARRAGTGRRRIQRRARRGGRTGDHNRLADFNRRAMASERAFIEPSGLPAGPVQAPSWRS
jgi:hypothetical protein